MRVILEVLKLELLAWAAVLSVPPLVIGIGAEIWPLFALGLVGVSLVIVWLVVAVRDKG